MESDSNFLSSIWEMLDPNGEVVRRTDLYLMKQEGIKKGIKKGKKEGKKEGIKEGREEGVNKLIESAIKLINKGVNINDVIEATGLSKELLLEKIK